MDTRPILKEKRKQYELMDIAFKLKRMHLSPGEEPWILKNLTSIQKSVERLLEEYIK